MYLRRRIESACCKGWPGIRSDMAISSNGIVRMRPTLNRRVISSNSSFASSPVTVLGSSAIPHIGQKPGSSRTICGCIGQVYSVFVAGALIVTGSRAMPHLGQEPGPALRTCGCIGHVYSSLTLVGFCGAERIEATCGLSDLLINLAGSARNFSRHDRLQK